jgi:hypothetical protein
MIEASLYLFELVFVETQDVALNTWALREGIVLRWLDWMER